MTVATFLRAYALLWAATLAVALAVAVIPGVVPAARDAFAFRLDVERAGTWREALSYFLANLRVVAALVLAAWARQRSRAFRPLLDALIVAAVASNAAVVGAALGAYGIAAASWLVHLPLEWAAVALPLAAAHAPESGGPSSADALACCLACIALLAAAAVVEAFG